MDRVRQEKISRGVARRIYPSGKTALRIKFQYRGVQCSETLTGLKDTKSNHKYAANLLGEIESNIARNTFNYAEYFPNSKNAIKFGHAQSKLLIKDAIHVYLQDAERSKEASTFRGYKKSCNSTLLPALGHFTIQELAQNPEPIRQMLRSKQATLKTLRNDMTPLRAIMDQAVDDGIIERNPCDKIKVNRFADQRKKSSYEIDPFSLEEIQRIEKAARKYNAMWADYFVFACFTGLRPSEIYALEWDKVDWEKREIKIDKAIVERGSKGTKTEAGTRVVDLTPMAYQALKSQKARTYLQSHLVWLHPHTGDPISDYETSQKPFDHIQKLAGVRRRTQRQTRHSYASNMLSGGENIYLVSKQMGHADVVITMKTYATWVEQGQKKKERVWESEFGQFSPSVVLENTDK